MEGGCRCGRVRVRISGKPLLTSACHCTGCQRMTASAFSLTVSVPPDALELLQGEVVVGGLHGDISHYHCDYCKSWLWTGPIAGVLNVRAPVFDDLNWFRPFVQTCTSEKLAWVDVPAAHSFPAFPEMSEWGKLMSEFGGSGISF